MILSKKEAETIRWKKGLKWERYELVWCDLCETASIVCPDCGNASCSCGGCEKCLKDHERFPRENYGRNFFIAKDGEEGKTVRESCTDEQWKFWCDLYWDNKDNNWRWEIYEIGYSNEKSR